MLSLDISYVLHVPGVQVVLTKQKVVAQYHPTANYFFLNMLWKVRVYHVILSDLIPSKHPNLAEFPLAGASNTNLMFSLSENAVII